MTVRLGATNFRRSPRFFNHPARIFAKKAHGDQLYGAVPYIEHLDVVVGVLRRFGIEDEDYLNAGYLHDVLEDTDVSRFDLIEQFGPYTAQLVDAVTDGKGANRKKRKERPLRMIPETPGSLRIKLADRIANVENALMFKNMRILNMYQDEHATMHAFLPPKQKMNGQCSPT